MPNPVTGRIGLSEMPGVFGSPGVAVQAYDLDPNLATFRQECQFPTIGTAAGTMERLLCVRSRGIITGLMLFATTGDGLTLATDNTNFISVQIVNKGVNGLGATNLLATTPAGVNTSKTTGGAALVPYAPYTLTPTGANLPVVGGQILAAQITVNGTLAKTLVEALFVLVGTCT